MYQLITELGALDFDNNKELNYTVQISDVFNLSDVNCSYISNLKLPKTENNVNLFNGLGLVSDTSRVPYSRVPITLLYNSVPLIIGGWLEVSNTTGTDYTVSVIDGMIDFFKLIEGKTLGGDLDLSASAHQKTVERVRDSQTSNIYKYLVADYGGRVTVNKFLEKGSLNIDYLTPSLSVPYVFRQIEQFTGYKILGSIFQDSDAKDLYLTYPKPPAENAEVVLDLAFLATLGNANGKQFEGYGFDNIGPGDIIVMQPPLNNFTDATLNKGSYNNNGTPYYEFSETGTFKVDFKMNSEAQLFLDNTTYYNGLTVEILVNNEVAHKETTPYRQDRIITLYRNFNAGDRVSFRYSFEPSPTIIYYRDRYFYSYKVNKSEIEINQSTIGTVSFSDALREMTIKDFFKEFMWRYGLTSSADNQSKTITFKTMNERITLGNVIDYSDKFINRLTESYNVPTFGQNSLFTHLYNGENESFNNGSFSINNILLEESKVIIASKIYSATEFLTDLRAPTIPALLTNGEFYNVPQLPIWQSEVKVDSNENIVVNYKALSGRFYFVKATEVTGHLPIASDILDGNALLNRWYNANIQGVHFNSLVPKYYGKHSQFLNVFKVHEIELKLTIFDFVSLDISKVFYFEQEKQFYILNKLTWGKNGICKGEFIRVII